MLEYLENELDFGDIWLFCHEMKDRRKTPRVKWVPATWPMLLP
jgi:hypothetical protein